MTSVPFDGTDDQTDDVGLVASLQARLADQLVALRRRTGGSLNAEARIALIGALLVSAGVVLVLLGWYGASRTSRVYLQIPYLISGGLLGVSLAVAGGSAYLASWMTRIAQDQRTQGDEAVVATRQMTETLERIEKLLAATLEIGDGDVPLLAETGYVSTPAGRLAHLPSCPTVAGRTDLRPVEIGPDGPAICRMCDPSAA